ncbi:MAG TPA: helix-turn-helix transcriptional regulator [Candidatus Binataceae bacterium]|nr:helix-turn-helix transcriptional regulator [Candidatus Binataceae bacterium]
MATKENKQRPGALIRKARQSLGLTQRDLAEMVGVKASHIAYIEGDQRNPSLALLRKLADSLNLNRQELLFAIHPDAKYLTLEQMPVESGSKPNGWRLFSHNRALLQRHRVTPAELKVLKLVDSLGPVSDPRNFLFVLNSIRMAGSGIL